jgi:NADP-dependent 3-hydroxy acid dehydrogenase YdfG
MAVNIKGVWLGCKAAVPEMRKNKYGKITSRVGRIVGDLQFTINTAITKR